MYTKIFPLYEITTEEKSLPYQRSSEMHFPTAQNSGFCESAATFWVGFVLLKNGRNTHPFVCRKDYISEMSPREFEVTYIFLLLLRHPQSLFPSLPCMCGNHCPALNRVICTRKLRSAAHGIVLSLSDEENNIMIRKTCDSVF